MFRLYIFSIYLFIFVVLGLNSGLHLESLHQPYFCEGFFETGSRELFARLASNPILLISAF
jgi:hypothetical protein